MEEFDRLVEVIAKLRAPNGCPWDSVQTHETLKPYLVEEVYEVLEAIDTQNSELLKEELGDLLLQIVLHAQIASEKKEFNIKDIAKDIAEKMIRRHPHVFADTKVDGVKEVWTNWEQIKKTEKAHQNQSILDSVPGALPALFRASKIQKKAARVGFDWTDIQDVIKKVREEIEEFTQESDKEKQIEEFGDVLFSLVNLSRKLEIDAEDSLRLATKKFENRFRYIEKKVAESGKNFKDYSLEQLDQFWDEAKTNLQ